MGPHQAYQHGGQVVVAPSLGLPLLHTPLPASTLGFLGVPSVIFHLNFLSPSAWISFLGILLNSLSFCRPCTTNHTFSPIPSWELFSGSFGAWDATGVRAKFLYSPLLGLRQILHFLSHGGWGLEPLTWDPMAADRTDYSDNFQKGFFCL